MITDDIQSYDDGHSTSQFSMEENSKTYKEIYEQRVLKIDLRKSSNPIIAAIIILLLIIIIIIIAIPYINEADKTAHERTRINYRSIFICNDDELWSFDVDTKQSSILQKTNDEITAFDTCIDRTIFWSENKTASINSLWNVFPNVTHTKKWKPKAIASDYVTEKVYFIDDSSGTLNVIDINSKKYGVMISELENLHDLALDPGEGLMFILQLSKAIVRANMDGTSAKRIIESSKISAITIDRKAGKIYWANDAESIEVADYEGRNRIMVMPIPMGVVSLSVFENRLFWTRSSSYGNVCPCTNILWSCEIYRKICTNITSHSLPFANPRITRTPYDQHRHLTRNPCEKRNGDCEHLCLMTSGGHDCACNTGWRLNEDGRTCSPVTEFMLYVQDDLIRGKILDRIKDSFTDAFVPTKIYVESLMKKPLVHFDYEFNTGDFFFSDDQSIFRTNILRDEEQVKLLSVESDYKVRDLAFDFVNRNMFYVKESQNPATNHSISVFSVAPEKKLNRTLLSSKYMKEHYINCPFNLIIHPNHEYLYYSEYNSISDNLRRIGTNGKGLSLVKPLRMNSMFNVLTLDMDKSRLYWMTTTEPGVLDSANLEGSDQRAVQIPVMADSILFAGVHKDWTYVGNLTEIWRIHHDSDLTEKLVHRRYNHNFPSMIHGLRIYSLAAQNAN